MDDVVDLLQKLRKNIRTHILYFIMNSHEHTSQTSSSSHYDSSSFEEITIRPPRLRRISTGYQRLCDSEGCTYCPREREWNEFKEDLYDYETYLERLERQAEYKTDEDCFWDSDEDIVLYANQLHALGMY